MSDTPASTAPTSIGEKTADAPTPILFERTTTISGAQELLDAGRALGAPILPGNGLQPGLIVPERYRFLPLTPEPERPLPGHIIAKVRLDDAASFVAYVKLYRSRLTRLFCNAPALATVQAGQSLTFQAILDYHAPGAGEDAVPSRAAHRALYPVPLSEEFAAWLGSNAIPFKQLEFATFIEERAGEIVAPDAATLSELVLNLEASTSGKFQSKIERVTGGRQLVFTEDVNVTAGASKVTVPARLGLRLPLFTGGKAYELGARLEYRIDQGRLTIAYTLERPEALFRQAVADLRAEIEADLETLPILTGAPA